MKNKRKNQIDSGEGLGRRGFIGAVAGAAVK
jgi:hypothetical protein